MNQTFPSAGIRVTIKSFVPTAIVNMDKKLYTVADTLLVSNGNGTVSQTKVNDPIRVDRRARVNLVFEVVAGDGTDAIYHPVGISFFGQHGGVGMEDFPSRLVSADPFNRLQLSVHDANLGVSSFEFKLIIQRANDGALGVIDPQVNNAVVHQVGQSGER
jgi:hypothetical protein